LKAVHFVLTVQVFVVNVDYAPCAVGTEFYVYSFDEFKAWSI